MPFTVTADRLKVSVLRRAGSSAMLPIVLEQAGLQTLAGKLDRLRTLGDLLAITLPAGPGALRSRRIKLLRRCGNDLAVEAMAQGGWYGFERPLPDVLLRSVQRFPGDMFDVGANTGLYALIAVEGRRNLVAHAFEPFPPVVAMLRENLALNPSGQRVRVQPVAASDTAGSVSLYVPAPSGQAVETSCSLDPDFKEHIADRIEVATVVLDDYWTELGRPLVSVLKVDTEGTEHRVLAGARKLIASSRPVVFYEFLPRGDAASLQQLASELRLVDIRLAPFEAVVGAPIGFDKDAWNHAFVPEERLTGFQELLREAGMKVTAT